MLSEEELPADASTLIYLAKANAFAEASGCVARILVPPSVWRESVEAGERIGAPEVATIRAAECEGFLRRVELPEREEALAERIAAEHRLGRGESEVLALATRTGRAIVDEGRASRVAAALGIATLSTLFLPLLGRRRRKLDQQAAVSLLHRLVVVTGARAEAVFIIEEALREEAR